MPLISSIRTTLTALSVLPSILPSEEVSRLFAGLDCDEEIADTYRLSKSETDDLFDPVGAHRLC